MPTPPTIHAIIASYNLVRQLAANNRLLIALVREHIEAEHQQAMLDATEAYNAALANLAAIHANLDEVRDTLIAQQAEIQTKLTIQRDTVLHIEYAIRAAESKAQEAIAAGRLPKKYRQQLVYDPKPMLPAARVYDIAMLERWHETFNNALSDLEEHITELQQQRQWYRRVKRVTWRTLNSEKIVIAGFILYLALFLWEKAFLSGEVPGNYWLAVGYKKFSFIAQFVLLIFALRIVWRKSGCVVYIVQSFLILGVVIWAVARLIQPLIGDFNNKYTTYTNSHTYFLASDYKLGLIGNTSSEHLYLFECNSAGYFCQLAGSTEDGNHGIKADQFNEDWKPLGPTGYSMITIRLGTHVIFQYEDFNPHSG